jgi:copper chaperone CopZ
MPGWPKPSEHIVITKSYAFDVSGMSCGGCVSGVQQALANLPGVIEAKVTLNSGVASVTCDSARLSAGQIQAHISALGYPAKLHAVT